jgi:hypothetical protein
MLASELIKELSAEIMEHGDREVWVLGTAAPKILAPAQSVRSDTVKPVEVLRLYDLKELITAGGSIKSIVPPPDRYLDVTVIEL